MQKEKLLMIPGPSPVHPRIINSLSLPTVSHVSPVLAEEFKEALVNLKKIVFCEKGEAFIVAGAGTLVLERTLSTLGYKFEAGSGLQAAKAILGEQQDLRVRER